MTHQAVLILVKNSCWDAGNNGQPVKAQHMSMKKVEVHVRKPVMGTMKHRASFYPITLERYLMKARNDLIAIADIFLGHTPP